MKTIKIPKVEDCVWVKIKKTQTTKYRFVLKRQVIANLEIPNDSTISIETDTCELNSTGDKAQIPPYNINRLLRFIFMEDLRKGI